MTEPEDRDLAIQIIGRAFDHPSLYMGGASRQAVRAAERALDNLAYAGLLLHRESKSVEER